MCCCTKLQKVFRTTLISANITAFIDRYRATSVCKTCLKAEELWNIYTCRSGEQVTSLNERVLSDYVIFSDLGTICRLLCLSKINKMVLQVIGVRV